MTRENRLVQLHVRSIKQSVRSITLPKQQAEAQQAFIALLDRGGSQVEIEAARLACSAIFEMQLDLCIESAAVQRELLELKDG